LLALCVPPLVPSVISRGAPRQATGETSVPRNFDLFFGMINKNEGLNWARNGRSILPADSNFHVNRRVILHAANLQHGTEGFISPPKEDMLWIFSPEKSDGFGRVQTRNLEYQRPVC
jgi:hypothetical protein